MSRYPDHLNNSFLSMEEIWDKSIFKITQLELEDGFFLDVYIEWKEIFEIDENRRLIDSNLKKYKSHFTKDFREQLSFCGLSVMVNYFFEEKRVRISYPKLTEELYIVNHMSSLTSQTRKTHQDIKKLVCNESYQIFKSHVSKIASMDHSGLPSIYEITKVKYGLCDLGSDEYKEVNENLGQIIKKLLIKIKEYRPSLFERITDFGLQLTAKYALLRIHQLKFIAILPSLDGDKTGVEVKRVLAESLRRLVDDSTASKRKKIQGEMRALPASYIVIFKILLFIVRIFPAGPLATSIRSFIRLMAKRFIAGESIETAKHSLLAIYKTNRDVTLDQLGELVVSEKEADNYKNEVLKLIKGYGQHVKRGEKNKSGIYRAHISIKVSALCNDFIPEAFLYTYNKVSPRLKEILLAAKEAEIFINIDAEHFHFRDIVFKVYKKLLLEAKELRDFAGTGIVVQAYLRDGSLHLDDIIDLAQERNMTMPIRLVKGAYWDVETVEADAHGHIAPEFLNKEETDLHFRQCIVKILDNYPHVQLCLASHNFADHCFAESLRLIKYSHTPLIEHQCLHMTYEALSVAMSKMNWVVRNYVPIGSLIVGMAYLVRRIMENSSQVGVLTIMRSHNKAVSLADPLDIHKENIKRESLIADPCTSKLSTEFCNIAPVRLYLENECKWIESKLDVKSYLQGQIISKTNGQFLRTGENQKIFSSSNENILVGECVFATNEDVQKAVSILDHSYQEGAWRSIPANIRSSVLIKASKIMLGKRNELALLISYEAGKSIVEALGDVDEAVDFLTFYARKEVEISEGTPYVESRGAIAVISPWNFPLAIPCGMVASALVAGNSVVLKSAEQTPLIAEELVNIFHAAGVGVNTLIHLPGFGESVGDALVRHERIAGIIFTGSKLVGQLINKIASPRVYFNKVSKLSYPVKVITEMGGKNAIIVTASAELDETVSEILYSSFGHSGQKCSACSRVIVHSSVKERLVERIKEACLDIKVGPAYSLDTKINPVVSKFDCERLKRQISEAADECKKFGGQIIVDRSEEELPGNCLGPAVFELPYKRAFDPDSYARKELFGPVVHIIAYNTLDEAIKLYNCTEYALTGGIFCQSEDDIDYVKPKIHSGNIYVNRSITGARVGIEPFGGYKLSGTGPKAGGREYVKSMHVFLSFLENSSEEENNYLDQEGNTYHFDLKRKSKLGITARLTRFSKAMNNLMMNFENLFGGLEIHKKKSLSKFQSWAENHYLDLMYSKDDNRVIPGQLSYNNYTMTQDRVLVLAYSTHPAQNILLSILGAIITGCGVTILCRNEKVFIWWNSFVNFFLAAGFSKENIDVYFCSQSLLVNALKDPSVDTIILDKNITENTDFYSGFIEVINENNKQEHLKKIINHIDSPNETDYKSLMLQFVKVRSFAVNIMRHGTQMDIESV